jgi:hypothetical protein
MVTSHNRARRGRDGRVIVVPPPALARWHVGTLERITRYRLVRRDEARRAHRFHGIVGASPAPKSMAARAAGAAGAASRSRSSEQTSSQEQCVRSRLIWRAAFPLAASRQYVPVPALIGLFLAIRIRTYDHNRIPTLFPSIHPFIHSSIARERKSVITRQCNATRGLVRSE